MENNPEKWKECEFSYEREKGLNTHLFLLIFRNIFYGANSNIGTGNSGFRLKALGQYGK